MAERNAEDIQGYEEEFINDVPTDYECPICQLPFRDPIQLRDCGHRFCRPCITRVSRELSSCCPIDRIKFTKDMYFEDKACRRTVLSFKVKCNQHKEGCSWIGELGDIKIHSMDCPVEMVPCPNRGCKLIIRRRFLQFHQSDGCEWRMVECVFCTSIYSYAEEQIHNDKCSCFPLRCVQCDQKGIAREKMLTHINDECSETQVICPYSKTGCSFYNKRSTLSSHLKEETNHHLALACEKMSKMEKSQEELIQRIENLEKVILSSISSPTSSIDQTTLQCLKSLLAGENF